MSTSSLKASEVLDWVAALMNDAEKTSYTYPRMLPYLNMAIDELQEEMERHNVPCTDETAAYITITAGVTKITSVESPDLPHYPADLREIRNLSERLSGSSDSFVPMRMCNFLNVRTPSQSLIDYAWFNQIIHLTGAVSDREVKLDYIRELIHNINTPDDEIGIIGVKSYLAYKTGAFCAKYVAENPERAGLLAADAEGCLDNILGIASKSQQNITTRRRPFRSSWKARRYT